MRVRRASNVVSNSGPSFVIRDVRSRKFFDVSKFRILNTGRNVGEMDWSITSAKGGKEHQAQWIPKGSKPYLDEYYRRAKWSAAPSSPVTIMVPAALPFLFSSFLAEDPVFARPYLLEILAVLFHY
jgi:hypothetical protein